MLVLDGQRAPLTSLFQATIYGRVVATMNVRKQPIKRWFYFDMVRSLASAEDREDAIIGVPETRIVRTRTDSEENRLVLAREGIRKAAFSVREACSTHSTGKTGISNIGNSIRRKPNSSTC